MLVVRHSRAQLLSCNTDGDTIERGKEAVQVAYEVVKRIREFKRVLGKAALE